MELVERTSPACARNACSHCLPAILAGLMVWCALQATHSEAAEERPATAVVEHLQETLLDVMKNAAQLGYEGRLAKLQPVVNETYDFNYIMRTMLGSSAGRLDPDELKQAVAAFRDASAAIYASEFNGYSGEQFVTLNEEATPRGMRIVRTRMQSPDGTNVRFDYMLHQTDGQWRIVNTIANGVSQLALDRSQAQAALKEKGFEGLMTWIKGRASQK